MKEGRTGMAYLGEDIKKLGFGLMRLPKDGEKSDVEQVKEMVDRFLAAGFTCRGFHVNTGADLHKNAGI